MVHTAVTRAGSRSAGQAGRSQSSTPETASAAESVSGLGGGLLTLVMMVLVVGLSVAPLFPRGVTPAGAPPADFSAERALPHLQAITARPHPVGSPANAQVRDYLLGQLAALGLEPQVQRAAVLNPQGDGGVVENVLVRLPGTANTRAVLIVAHYDSAVGAPGAADNGMNVAALVETLRALQAGSPLHNDLIVLFDDGEESGLLGSLAFIREHPWARDVGLVFDFDGDGPVGPPTLLWTTPGDRWLVGEIAEAHTGLLAMSVVNPEKRQDFGNDLHVFAAAGYSGAHIDRIGGSTFYHTPRDTFDFVDAPSLQRQGDAMLALARHFGNLPLGAVGETPGDDAIFFTLLGLPILSYPAGWAVPLALLAGLALATAVGIGLRRGRLTPRGVAFGLLALLIGPLGLALAGHLVWQPILASHPESLLFTESDFYGQDLFVAGLYVLVVAVVLVAVPRLFDRLGVANVAVAGTAWLVTLALLLSAIEPFSSFLALWPALFGALGALSLTALPIRTAGPWPWGRLAVPLLTAIPALGLPGALVVQSTIDGVSDGPAVPIAVLALTLGALALPISQVARLGRGALPAGAALIGIGFLIAGSLTSGFSPTQPRPDTLLYVLNADTGAANWVSTDPAPDEWTGRFLADGALRTSDELFGDGGSGTLRAGPAPVAPFRPPQLDRIAVETTGDLSTLRLRLTSPRGADRVILRPTGNAQLLAAGLDGAPPVPIEGGELRLAGLPADGIELTLRVRAGGPVRLNVIDLSAGLPEIPGMTLPMRPETVMSSPNPPPLRGYPTAVRTSVVVATGA